MSIHTTTARKNVVSIRLDDEHVQRVLAFRDSFDPPETSAALRWLLADPRVHEIMRERITSVTSRKRNGQLPI